MCITFDKKNKQKHHFKFYIYFPFVCILGQAFGFFIFFYLFSETFVCANQENSLGTIDWSSRITEMRFSSAEEETLEYAKHKWLLLFLCTNPITKRKEKYFLKFLLFLLFHNLSTLIKLGCFLQVKLK